MILLTISTIMQLIFEWDTKDDPMASLLGLYTHSWPFNYLILILELSDSLCQV